MDILTINDVPGQYPPSWYAATADAPGPYAPAKGQIDADVLVVGGGFTGLSAALHLARRGYDVALIEASRVGFGASGRNGGQVGTGQRLEQEDLEDQVGDHAARQLWDMSLEAVQLVRDTLSEAGLADEFHAGVIHADHRPRYARHSAAHADHMNRKYGYDQISFLDQARIREEVGSASYFSGTLDLGAGHIHPLRYVFALARLAAQAGVRTYEQSRMTGYRQTDGKVEVTTDQATIRAKTLVMGLNGYHNNLVGPVARRVMPINNYIAVTEPLGDERARSLIRNNHAVADSRFVINYFRLSADNRMIFGGGESYGYRFPSDLRAKVMAPMLEVFPQMSDARIDYAWGGTLGITMSRLPHFSRPEPNVYSMAGFSGHGIAIASLAGKLAAEAISGDAERFDLMSRLPTSNFPGGTLLRTPLLIAAMLWYSLRDRI